MADWAIDLYTTIKRDMLAKRGPGAQGINGALPVTMVDDCTSMLANIHGELLRALAHATSPEHATIEHLSDALGAGSLTVTLDAWISLGRPTGDPLVRELPSKASITSWLNSVTGEGWIDGTLDAAGVDRTVYYAFGVKPGQVGGAAVAMLASKSDRLFQLAASFARTPTIKRLTPDQTVEWWKAFYGQLIAISVVLDIPTPGLGARIIGGIKYAATETAIWVRDEAAPAVGHAVGEVAADVGKATGETLGAAAQGFAGKAGLTAWMMVIVGIMLWMKVR